MVLAGKSWLDQLDAVPIGVLKVAQIGDITDLAGFIDRHALLQQASPSGNIQLWQR